MVREWGSWKSIKTWHLCITKETKVWPVSSHMNYVYFVLFFSLLCLQGATLTKVFWLIDWLMAPIESWHRSGPGLLWIVACGWHPTPRFHLLTRPAFAGCIMWEVLCCQNFAPLCLHMTSLHNGDNGAIQKPCQMLCLVAWHGRSNWRCWYFICILSTDPTANSASTCAHIGVAFQPCSNSYTSHFYITCCLLFDWNLLFQSK